MKRMSRMFAVTLTAMAVAVAAAGCTPEQQAQMEKLCRENPAECKDLNRVSEQQGNQPSVLTAQAVGREAIPAQLQGWADQQTEAQAPASIVITEGGSIYVGVAGGLKNSGGYSLKLGEFRRHEGGWVARAQVVEPAPGTMVTMVMMNPMAFYRLPVVEGQVQVEFERAAAPAPAPQEGDVLSDNFRVVKPKLAGNDKIQLEGKARAFEGVFQVEVWAGGKKLATQPVKASQGAPEFGQFSLIVTVPGGVPRGAEVRFQLANMKDGGWTTELIVPVAN